MTPSRKHRETAGVQEPTVDLFGDVKRALNAWLMKNDKTYQTASRLGSERNARRKDRQKAETEI